MKKGKEKRLAHFLLFYFVVSISFIVVIGSIDLSKWYEPFNLLLISAYFVFAGSGWFWFTRG